MIIPDLQLAETAVEEYVIHLLSNSLTKGIRTMGERYESNPAEVVAGFQVFPEDEYVVELGEPKGNKYNTKDGPKAGIRVGLRISEGTSTGSQFKSKVMSYFGDELNDFGKAANKRLVMAALGLEVNDENEKKFNTEIAPEHGWGFDSSGPVDDGWLLIKGKVVYAKVSINTDKEGKGKQYQSFDSFRPYPGTAKTA